MWSLMLQLSSKPSRYENTEDIAHSNDVANYDLLGNVSDADGDRPDHGGRQHILPAFGSHV